MSKLVKPREDPAVVLQLIDEAFHQVPLPIPVAVILSLLFGSLMRRDHRFCSTPNHQVNECLSRIPPISDDPLEGKSRHQRSSMRAIVAVASCQMDTQRVAQAINEDVEFGAETSSASSQRLLVLRTVFFEPQQRRDGPAQSCCPQSHVPCQARGQSEQACVPRRPGHTNERSVWRCYSSCHTLWAGSAIALQSGQSTARLPRSGGRQPRCQRRHVGRFGERRAVSSRLCHSDLQLSCDNRTLISSNVNRP